MKRSRLNTTPLADITPTSSLFCNIPIEMLKHENNDAPVKENERVNET